jgi:acetyltransferase EpsM
MKLALYVLGAGGHGKVVAEAALRADANDLLGFLDDDARRQGAQILGRPVAGGFDDWARLQPDAVLALGLGDNAARLLALTRARERGVSLATVIHPAATVSSGATIGEGSYVGPGAVVHVDARLGAACIVNSLALVEHDCVLGDGVHVSPRAALGGGVRLGEGVHVGLGAAVLPRVTIGAFAVIGAGSVVTRDLPDRVVAWGAPARVRRSVIPNEGP